MMIYIIDVLLYVILQLNEIKSQLSPAGENKGKQRSEKKLNDLRSQVSNTVTLFLCHSIARVT
jgi:hypothetical protein